MSKINIVHSPISLLISSLLVNLVAHLACFVAVAEELHFGRAAARLGMAQPPLSQRIQRLEKELGVRLFDRSSRKVELTEAGRLLLGEARDILVRVERVHTIADRSHQVGSLRAGVPSDLGRGVLAALIAAFRERRPDTPLDLRPLGTAAQVRGLADGGLDVGVLRHPADTDDLVLGPMLAQPVGVLVPAGSPWAAAREVHLSDLAGSELVVFPREEAPGAYDLVLGVCRRHGFEPAAVRHSPHPEFTLGLVLAGAAVAVAPHTDDSPGVVWRPLLGRPLVWQTSCAWRGGHELLATIEDFTAAATEILRTEAGMALVGSAPRRRVVVHPASGFLA
ncbi:LysR substrate-binding domain-containing protein [Yinghuangia sp. ASG 101]|uniref:LysR substrate-binding domain-containing protein n=1 Tax=Yinghuangia sp. ASG 101 TaxID=2896848 RepID=UPI001E44248E|nr:LysR substrate-binding domain-containing protein [Yinghuangia sp. ASG 101]UGQ11756.1 LysR substrate-binding domain-containing protein [Yinghuangia sp. ASG 101]